MSKVVFTSVTGRMIKCTAWAHTLIQMATSTQENGKMTSSMVEGRKHGRMELSMKVTMKMVRSTEMESSASTMAAPLKVNSLETRWRV